MAYFSESNLVDAQALLQSKFQNNELRIKQAPALKLGVANAEPLVPSAKNLRTREDRPVHAYVLARSKRNTTNARSHNPAGARGNSFSISLSYKTYADTFSISLKEMDNNMFTWQETFAQQVKNAILNLYTDIETDRINTLYTARTQVVQTTTPARCNWNAATFAHEISLDNTKQFYQIAESAMAQNYYETLLDAIASPGVYIDGQFWASQGAQNATNTSFQFANVNVYRSTDLNDANYPNGIALVMPAQSYAVLDWIPHQNVIGWGDMNTYNGGYSKMKDPFGSGLTFAVYGRTMPADNSASGTARNGSTQDQDLNVEISVDIADVLSPLSVSNESVVYEFASKA